MVSQRPHRPLSVLKTRAVRGKLREEPFSFNVPSAFLSLQNECGNAITPYFSNSLMLGFFFLSLLYISPFNAFLPMTFHLNTDHSFTGFYGKKQKTKKRIFCLNLT